MGDAARSNSAGGHQFGGCDRLLGHYRLIGRQLLECERSQGGLRSLINFSALQLDWNGEETEGGFSIEALANFRQGVVIVPVEVLESYLDDLLDLDVDEANLFIARRRPIFGSALISLLGMCAAMSIGLYAVSLGVAFFFSLTITVFLALPFAVLWHFVPREQIVRRVRFAKLLSHEIARRRGRDGPLIPLRNVRHPVLQKLWGGKSTPSAHGAARGLLH